MAEVQIEDVPKKLTKTALTQLIGHIKSETLSNSTNQLSVSVNNLRQGEFIFPDNISNGFCETSIIFEKPMNILDYEITYNLTNVEAMNATTPIFIKDKTVNGFTLSFYNLGLATKNITGEYKVFTYNIGAANNGNTNKIYSPREQKIGWWQEEIDGVLKQKILYGKSYPFTHSSQTTTIPLLTVFEQPWENIEYIVSGEVFQLKGPDNFSTTTYYYGGSDYYNSYFNLSSKDVIVRSGSSWPKLPSKMCLRYEYTKTTDEWEIVNEGGE